MMRIRTDILRIMATMNLVPVVGLEPTRPFKGPQDFKSCASAISPHRLLVLRRGTGPRPSPRNVAEGRRRAQGDSPVGPQRKLTHVHSSQQGVDSQDVRLLACALASDLANLLCAGIGLVPGRSNTMKYQVPFRRLIRLSCLLAASAFFPPAQPANAAPILRVLFLGDNGHHRPADRFKQLQPVLAKRGIEMEYTEKLDDLNSAKLAGYDALADRKSVV